MWILLLTLTFSFTELTILIHGLVLRFITTLYTFEFIRFTRFTGSSLELSNEANKIDYYTQKNIDISHMLNGYKISVSASVNPFNHFQWKYKVMLNIIK